MLISLKEILADTRKKGYAVGLFNCVTLEMTMGILQAAEETRSPVIIGPAEVLLPSAGLIEYACMMKGLAEKATVPVALHFDHGYNPDLVRQAINLGFTSVMYDCSVLPLEENCKRVREMAEYAHSKGCSIEAELGHVGSNSSAEAKEVEDSIYTIPSDAALFAAESHCDALAVAIGTAHGVYTKAPVLDTARLAEIAAATTVPLVLHGGSGLTDQQFKATVSGGISKINIFTDNNLAAAKAAYDHYSEKTGAFELMPHITKAVKEATINRIRVFGSDGHA